ncbi:MAG: Virion structural protein [uncultured bacterium]|nr:MAG: Virion structural protein [uncultured bacterium]
MSRKKAEDFIISYIEKLLPKSGNREIYFELFASMSDKQFDDFMKALEDGTKRLAIIAPNLADSKLSINNNLAIADELGHNFFERIWMVDSNSSGDVPPYLSPLPYLIVDLPLRRQAQLLVKKVSIPENNRSIDDFTGQPTGASKGSKISYPEIQILSAINLEESLVELLKVRGGDLGSFDAANDSISKTGGFSLKAIEHLGTGVISTQTLHTLLTAMHLKNSLL